MIMSNMKYRLLENDTVVTEDGVTLYRIQAVRHFRRPRGKDVQEGQLGGYVESVYNLSEHDTCWIAARGRVYGNGKVREAALVGNDARVYGDAVVFGDSVVGGNAQVYGNALIHGKAVIRENATVRGDAEVYRSAHVEGDILLEGDSVTIYTIPVEK